MIFRRNQETSRLPELVCVSLLVMWGQGSEVIASPRPLKDATFKTMPASDVMFTEDVLWEKPARSRLECSVMCRGDGQCLMVTFQPGTHSTPGSCRSHGKRKSPPELQKFKPGACSFNLVNQESWLQKSCTSNTDCRGELLAACFSGRCLCDGGLFFDGTLNACVSACTRGLGDTFVEYKSMDFNDHDEYQTSAFDDPSTCQTKCSADPKCVVIVYNSKLNKGQGFCFYKYATAQDFALSWYEEPVAIAYQRTCKGT